MAVWPSARRWPGCRDAACRVISLAGDSTQINTDLEGFFYLLNLLDLREIMLPGCHLPPLTGLGWTGGFLAQGFRWRSTPAYELAAPNGACQ